MERVKGATIRVAADANLDWTNEGEARRDCLFQAIVDRAPVASTPVYLFGPGELSEVDKANAELVTAQAAIECCLADGNCANSSTYGPWDGTTHYASDYLGNPAFKTTYTIDAAGFVVTATLNLAPGETAWAGIGWDSGTSQCVNV